MTEAAQDQLRPINHGNSYAYNRLRCRCDVCRQAELRRQKEWRARNRAGLVKHRPNHPNCVPVRVRGVIYPSISVAAATLKICPTSITGQLRLRGSADGAGLGGRSPRPRGKSGAKRCLIHGREFPSIAAAARALNVSYSHMAREFKAGPSAEYWQYLLSKLMQADRALQGRSA